MPIKLILETSNMRFTKKYLLLFIFSTTLFFGQIKTTGLPEIRNYKRIQYDGETQNWAIDQDTNGNIYFANNEGLIQFDGSSWQKYTIPNSNSIRSIKIDNYRKIYVGGYNEFGYFKSNSKGKLIYYSLSKLVNRHIIKNFDFIWKIHILGNEVIFQSFAGAFVLKNNKLKFIAAPDRFQFSFKVNNQLYFQDASKGIVEYINGKLIPLKGSTVLNNTEIWGMIAMPDNKILITTLNKGLYIYDGEKMNAWNTAANVFIKKNSSLGGVMIKNNFIVLNSVLDGIIICDLNGKIVQHISHKVGLQNNTVLTSFIDSSNNLWLGLDNGIDFINENSPFSYFSSNIGTVYASVVFKGNLYVATNQGLFYHPWNGAIKDDNFILVEGTTGQAWNIQVIQDQLLCSHNTGALLIEGGKIIKTIDYKGYFGFKSIPNRPNYIIGSTYNGFNVFEKVTNGWHLKNKIEGFNMSVNTFEMDEKNIWVIKDELIHQMDLADDLKKFKSIKTYKNLSSSVKGIGSIQKIKNSVYFQTNNRFFTFSSEQGLFFEDIKMSSLFKKVPEINFLREDNHGNIWYLHKKSLGVLMKNTNGKYKNITNSFSNLTNNLVNNYLSITTINSENIFIGLKEGLVHYNSKSSNILLTKPKAFIRSFSFPGDKLLFGNGQDKIRKIKLPYASNHVKFTFSSPTYDNPQNVKFSYQLEGFDENWSNWSSNTIKEYTFLKEGNYTMKLKVSNSTGIQSKETSIPFTISPPWYRHLIAYFVYLILLIIAIYLIHQRINAKIRKNSYYKTLEQRRIYLEKEAKNRQEQNDLEKEIERLKKEKLKTVLLTKDKELVNNTMMMAKNNKTLKSIILKLNDFNIESFDESTKSQYIKLQKSISKELKTDKSWSDLEKHIKNVHFDFLKRLKEKFPTITSREMDLATFLLMNMSTKEISEIMNITQGGVDLARFRLRRRLELNNKENLSGFLISI